MPAPSLKRLAGRLGWPGNSAVAQDASAAGQQDSRALPCTRSAAVTLIDAALQARSNSDADADIDIDAGAQPLALMLVDLDNFHTINDSLGYAVGERVLGIMMRRLDSVLDPGSMVQRLGGDEFLVLLPGHASPQQAADTAGLIRDVVQFPVELDDGRRILTASIGISQCAAGPCNAAQLLRDAELAMVEAKNVGKNRHCFYQPHFYEHIRGRMSLEKDLVEAIADNQFFMVYEPRVALSDWTMSGMEALVRWHHPQRGVVSPMEFIGLAEETGLIDSLGRLIIEHVVRQAASWYHAGQLRMPVSVNLSAYQLSDPELVSFVRSMLAHYALPARLLDLELTESTAVTSGETASAKQLAALRALGMRLLIDDFGTGYSSLSQLQHVCPDVLKIDRSFVTRMSESNEGEVFVNAIISMAHALSMPVIAEGVETVAQLRQLRALGCDEVQGYLLTRPVAAHDMTALLGLDRFPDRE